MAVGDQIDYAKYLAMVPVAWRITPSWEDTNVTVYLASCSFVAKIRVTSVLWRTSKLDFTAYYYNGSSWIYVYSKSLSQKNSGSQEQYYYHNREAEGTTSADQHQHHLWKFVVTMDHPGSAHGYFNIWAGGLETMTQNEYNSYFKGNKIHGINCTYSTSSSDIAFVSANHPSIHRGTPISIASNTHKYICHEA